MMVMSSGILESLQRAVRAAAAGSDPGRAIGEALRGVTAASGATGAVTLSARERGMRPTIAAMAGHPDPVAIATAEAAISSGRMHRRRSEGCVAAAIPVRFQGVVIGAVAVHGPTHTVDTGALPPFADVIALLLGHGQGVTRHDGVSRGDVLEAVAELAAQPGRAGVLVKTLGALERVFGATASCCVLHEGSRMTVAHVRNLDGEALRLAA